MSARNCPVCQAVTYKDCDAPCPRGDRLAAGVWRLLLEGEEQGWVAGIPPDTAQRLDVLVNEYCVDGGLCVDDELPLSEKDQA